MSDSHWKHGAYVGGKESRTHRSWRMMRARCTDPKNNRWKQYGGRGITICDRWRHFPSFLEDMGERPAGMTIERQNNDRNYCKENCRWATQREQQNHRRNNRIIRAFGKSLSVSDWARDRGIDPRVIYARIKRGMDSERALTNWDLRKSILSLKASRFLGEIGLDIPAKT